MCPLGAYLVPLSADSEEEDEEEDGEEKSPGDADVVVFKDRTDGSFSAVPNSNLPIDSQPMGPSNKAAAVPTSSSV